MYLANIDRGHGPSNDALNVVTEVDIVHVNICIYHHHAKLQTK